MFNGIFLTMCGLLLIITGFWESAQRSKRFTTLLAWLLPIGLLITLSGIILMLIPDFFS